MRSISTTLLKAMKTLCKTKKQNPSRRDKHLLKSRIFTQLFAILWIVLIFQKKTPEGTKMAAVLFLE